MWIRLAAAGEVEFVDEFLTVAHDTPGSLTKVYKKDEDKYVLQVIRRHIIAAGNIFQMKRSGTSSASDILRWGGTYTGQDGSGEAAGFSSRRSRSAGTKQKTCGIW